MRPLVLRAALRAATLASLAACHSASPATAPTPVAPSPAVAPPPRDSAPPAPPIDSAPVAPQQLTTQAVRIFGDSTAAAPATGPAPTAAPAWDIDVRSFETRQRVTYYIGRFQNEARPRFAIWLQRGGRYEPMIRAKLRAAGLPEDLTYLALIESGYDPNAYSSAAAIGIWQLMTGTARSTGLRVDWWIDERRDPVRSTDGALRFLGWLDRQFGSLYLAAAAYNGGPGRVARGLKRYSDELGGQAGDSAFFALAETDYLRAETRDYVPKLIAAAIVAKDPKRYGFDVTPDPALAYDSVLATPALPLASVASAAGVTLGAVLDLNYQILRGMTPPKGNWWVRVPSGLGARAGSALAGLGKKERAAGKRVELEHAGTMATVSKKYGLTTRELIWFNPSLKHAGSSKLTAGTRLFIPTAATLAGARDVPDPALEKYGSSRRHAVTHVVKQGETLAGIAAHFDTSVATLKRLNGLKLSVIYPGQVIVVRAGGSKKTAK